MIFATGTRAVYTMSLPSSCDIELDSPVCRPGSAGAGERSPRCPARRCTTCRARGSWSSRCTRRSIDRGYPSCSSVISRRRAVGRARPVLAATSLTVSSMAVGPKALITSSPRASASTKSPLPLRVGRPLLGASHSFPPRRKRLPCTTPVDPALDHTSQGSARRADRCRPVAGAAGPYCSMLLADLGATVIKVESPAGDDTRTWMPPERDGVSTYFMSINRNKQSIVLDFRDPDDVALVHELFRRADIVIENFKPGGLAKFGLDYESARAINPALIYLSISGFGTAEGAWLPGYDLVVQAVSGSDEPDRRARRAGVPRRDLGVRRHDRACTARSACSPRSASARETGQGQHVEVNLLSSALSGLVNQSGAFTAGGVVPHRMGNAHPSVYPYQTMPTKDRDVIIAAANDRQFRRCARCWASPRSPTTSGSVSTPTAPRTAISSIRSWSTSLASGRPTTCSSHSTRPACRADRSTRSARASSWPSGSGSNPASRWATAIVRSTSSATRSLQRRRHPLRRAAAPARRALRRDPGLAVATPRPRTFLTGARDIRHVPNGPRRVRRRLDQAARSRSRRRPDGQDHASASWPTGWSPSADRPPASGRCSRRCSSPSPTTVSRRPRSPPRHVAQRARFDPGRARRRAARRRLTVPRRDRGRGQLPRTRRIDGARRAPDRRCRMGRGRGRASWPTTQGGGPVRPRARSPGAQARRSAHAGAVRAGPRARPVRSAPGAVRAIGRVHPQCSARRCR